MVCFGSLAHHNRYDLKETNDMTNKLSRHEPLTRENAVLLMVDHQVGLYTGVRDIDTLELNVVGLTKTLRAMKIPVVVTTTTEKMWGPLIPGLAEALQSVPKIERTTVNAWTEKRVVDAVKSTGRKKLIVTGISTDVCLAFPAISALADGYETFGVIDASGAFSKMLWQAGQFSRRKVLGTLLQ
jgi:nicotinamidase-related amidase